MQVVVSQETMSCILPFDAVEENKRNDNVYAKPDMCWGAGTIMARPPLLVTHQ